MKSILYIIILAVSTSCSTYFHMGNASSQARKHRIPAYEEDIKGSFQLGASYTNIVMPYELYVYDKFSELTSFDGNIYYAESRKKDYVSFGAYGYGGVINTTQIGQNLLEERINAGKFNFYGIGIDFEYGMNIPGDKIEWRPVGFRIAYQSEAGSYVHYKDDIVEASKWKVYTGLSEGDPIRPYFRKGNPNNIGAAALLTHEVLFKKLFIPMSIDLSYGMGIGFMVGSIGVNFTKGPFTIFLRSTHNVDAHFYNAGLNLNLVNLKKRK